MDWQAWKWVLFKATGNLWSGYRPPATGYHVEDERAVSQVVKVDSILQEFKYIEGAKNVVPNCLSRLREQPEPSQSPPAEDVWFPYMTEQLARLPVVTTVAAAIKKLKQHKIQEQKR